MTGNFPDLSKAKFFLFFENDKNPDNIRGAFFYIRGRFLDFWTIESVISKRQTVTTGKYELETKGVSYDRLLTVVIREQKELLCLFYINNSLVSNVNFKLHKSLESFKVKSFQIKCLRVLKKSKVEAIRSLKFENKL